MLTPPHILDIWPGTILFILPFLPILVLLLWALCTTAIHSKTPSRTPPAAPGAWPVLGSLEFFTKRWRFYRDNTRMSPSGNFSFKIGRHSVIALSGEDQRKVFFEHKGLACAEGYSTLLAGSPSVKPDNNAFAETHNGNSGFTAYFQRRLVTMLKANRLEKGLPQLLQDVRASLDDVSSDGSLIIDPFTSIYDLIFKITMRTVACDDIANDPALLAQCLRYFETIEGSATPLSIIFPRMPSWSKAKRTHAGFKLYTIFKKLIESRAGDNCERHDALQYLIDQGDGVVDIISFVLGALFAGQLNSGINTSFVLCYLAKNKEWHDKVSREVQDTANRYSPDSTLPLKDRLMHVPLEAWESEFKAIDLCLKETIRLQMSGCAFRYNRSNKDIPLGGSSGEVIPQGAFVAMAAGDMHYNSDIYTHPDEWDPSRYLPGRAEDKKQAYSWMGWGLARHPCLGVRFAKLENNLVVAFFLAYFSEFELTDKRGSPIGCVPACDRDSYTPRKPTQDLCLKLKDR